MEDVTLIIMAIFGVLSLILFFKVWGMCNDVSDMKERIKEAFPTEEEKRRIDIAGKWQAQAERKQAQAERKQAQANGTGFNVGDSVIYEPMNRKMIVKEITNDGMLVCVSYKQNGKEEYEGTYRPEQVKILY